MLTVANSEEKIWTEFLTGTNIQQWIIITYYLFTALLSLTFTSSADDLKSKSIT